MYVGTCSCVCVNLHMCVQVDTFNHTASRSLGAMSHLTLETPWTVAHQAPLSMGFSRQESWSGFPFPSSVDLPNPGIEPRSPALQADSLPTELWGKPNYTATGRKHHNCESGKQWFFSGEGTECDASPPPTPCSIFLNFISYNNTVSIKDKVELYCFLCFFIDSFTYNFRHMNNNTIQIQSRKCDWLFKVKIELRNGTSF